MSATKESIKEYVIESLSLFDVERESIVEDASLESLGVDSLDLTELGQAVRKKFQIRVQPRDFQDVRTVGDALQVFYDKSAAA